MIQLAFNRPQSFPRVLVAQSMVGRKVEPAQGLSDSNSAAIRNGTPESLSNRFGRVDRVDSCWCVALRRAIENDAPADELPRIEIHP